MSEPQKKSRIPLLGLILTIAISTSIALLLMEGVLNGINQDNTLKMQFYLSIMDEKLTGAMTVLESNATLLDVCSKSLSRGVEVPKQTSEAFETNIATLETLFHGSYGFSNLIKAPSKNTVELAASMNEANESAMQSLRHYCSTLSNQTAALRKQGEVVSMAVQYKTLLEIVIPALSVLAYFLFNRRKKD